MLLLKLYQDENREHSQEPGTSPRLLSAESSSAYALLLAVGNDWVLWLAGQVCTLSVMLWDNNKARSKVQPTHQFSSKSEQTELCQQRVVLEMEGNSSEETSPLLGSSFTSNTRCQFMTRNRTVILCTSCSILIFILIAVVQQLYFVPPTPPDVPTKDKIDLSLLSLR